MKKAKEIATIAGQAEMEKRSLATKVLNRLVVPVVRHVHEAVALRVSPLVQEIQHRTNQECVDYIYAKMQTALQLSSRYTVLDHAMEKVTLNGIYAEFGVYKGDSINFIADHVQQTVYGFDSFEGLKEDWKGWGTRKGDFNLNGELPSVRSNVKLIKGWFDATLPSFLAENTADFAFLHVDSDTYEAATCLFKLAGSRIKTGTVIVFDEYFGYRGWKIGEYKAWQEFVASRSLTYEYLSFCQQEVALIVT